MNDHHHVYTKSRLIKELAFRAGIKKVASRQILEVLAEIIKRETPNGPFILPGLCKFELVPRKARRIRNPRTGELLIMPPQKALKITAARSAKMAIAPRIPARPSPVIRAHSAKSRITSGAGFPGSTGSAWINS